MADPTDTGYIPLPDWYFLFLYQLLKYEFAAGSYTVVGAMIMPGIAFGALYSHHFLILVLNAGHIEDQLQLG